jgi:putative copper resistance protein D
VVSGAAWLAVQTVAMSGLRLGEALAGGVLWIILSKTQFGTVSVIRFALAVLLAISLALAGRRHGARLVSAVVATGLLVAIAWTGHAAGTVGPIGPLHLTADALHLLAAGAWIGGLLALLLLLLTAARQQNDKTWVSVASHAARRFSNVGIVSVGSLLATGAINSWILVGSFSGLIATDYGLLVLGKIALFTIMTSIAVVNRLQLTPLLSEPPGSLQVGALHGLTRNVVIEITLGLTVIMLVGVVGTLHPAIHIVQ